MLVAFAPHLPSGDATAFGVHQWHQLRERVLVAV
jgi:hypothetical protein